MYIPKLYREEEHETILNFLRANNFPALVTHGESGLVATHLPVEIAKSENGGLIVYGHISRANPQWKSFNGQEALLIFSGPHTYISPRWYNHVNVPTWNYTMIHLYGIPRVLEGEEARQLLSRLVSLHEKNTGYSLESLPQDFVEKEIKGIVAFTVEITRIDAGFKLSQNRNDEDHANIVSELKKRDDEYSHQIAEEMKRQRNSA